MKWIQASFSVSLVTNGFDMIDNVLTILKRLEDKHASADTSEPNAAYDMIGDLIYCINTIASEMSSGKQVCLPKDQNEVVDSNSAYPIERARFERWIKLGPNPYYQIHIDLAWDAWLASRTFET